jgi:hypothetical protein
MIDREGGDSQSEKLAAGYRGSLVYRPEEDGYKLITMMVFLYPGEQSRVESHIYNLPLEEEAEHLSAFPPLAVVDSYHFPATDGTNIMLTIESQGAKHTAVYSVYENGVEEHSPFLRLDIVESGKGRKALTQETRSSHDQQYTFNDVLNYYKDQIPSWLEEQDRLDTTTHETVHDNTIDFGR